MSPVAITKFNDVAESLWQIFAANEALLPLDRRRYENEATQIAKDDPVGAAFIKVLLAGIAGDSKKALKGIDSIVNMGASPELFANSIRILRFLGKMRDAYRIAQLGVAQYPLSKELHEIAIDLAVAHEDIDGLEKKLAHWSKVFPGSLPSAGEVVLLNETLSAMDDEALVTDFLSQHTMDNNAIEKSPLPKRIEDLLDTLLAKVDP